MLDYLFGFGLHCIKVSVILRWQNPVEAQTRSSYFNKQQRGSVPVYNTEHFFQLIFNMFSVLLKSSTAISLLNGCFSNVQLQIYPTMKIAICDNLRALWIYRAWTMLKKKLHLDGNTMLTNFKPWLMFSLSFFDNDVEESVTNTSPYNPDLICCFRPNYIYTCRYRTRHR